MISKETNLLEEAYLSISKKLKEVPSDSEVAPSDVVDTSPVSELAPNVEVGNSEYKCCWNRPNS